MQLKQISIRNFRCIESVKLELDAELNWIVGQNASGKTSLLEALFFAGHGRSFRSSRPDQLIMQGSEGLEVVAWLQDRQREIVLGVARDKDGTRAKLGGENLRGMAGAATALPVVVLDSGMNDLVSGGPVERRRWLDWGVFHVEQSFLPVWRAFQAALRQRNEALKHGLAPKAVLPWTRSVAETGEQLTALRIQHFRKLEPLLEEYLAEALGGVPVRAVFRQGWAADETYAESLERFGERDRETGGTRRGPHRAEIELSVEGAPAVERLSRGQQKMAAGALWLAQVKAFTDGTGQAPLLLVDDLAAELDTANLDRFLSLLSRQKAQRILTAINEADVVRTGLENGRLFHVEHGQIRPAEAGSSNADLG